MRAHLVLKRAGASQGNETVFPTAATIKKLLASSETVEQTENAARKLGFKVIDVTPFQVTIEGPKEKFEKAFSIRLKPAGSARKTPAKKTSKKKPIAAETPVESQLWMWESTPELPVEMEGAVQEIVLPQAIALH